MSNELYVKITESFHFKEKEDFESMCGILDNHYFFKRTWCPERLIAVISDDPYLLLLIFTSLIRYSTVHIHIVNPAEGNEEVQRLLDVIKPDCVICTNSEFEDKLSRYKRIFVDGNELSQVHGDTVLSPTSIDFTVINYSPYPSKIYNVPGEIFRSMIYALVYDLEKFNLADVLEGGLIPIITKNPDYLLYFIAVKIARVGSMKILPSAEDSELIIKNRKLYLQYNHMRTMFIPKKEFCELWEEKIASLFENKFMFRSYLKRKWLVNIIIRHRLKKLFKGFNKVLIIGALGNAYMVHVLKNLPFVRFYSAFPLRGASMYGPISYSLEEVILSVNEYRLSAPTRLEDVGTFKGKPICLMSFKMYHPDNKVNNTITDLQNRWVEDEITDDNGTVKRFFHLGDIRNSFDYKSGRVFPETLERVINSYPFIKHCVLLTFNKKMILVIHPNQDVLDSNRINYKTFSSIIQKQIDVLNKELPESYKIQGFVVTTSLIEQDRNGEVVRFPFNYCNKWSG